jgi:hypothetical protein
MSSLQALDWHASLSAEQASHDSHTIPFGSVQGLGSHPWLGFGKAVGLQRSLSAHSKPALQCWSKQKTPLQDCPDGHMDASVHGVSAVIVGFASGRVD